MHIKFLLTLNIHIKYRFFLAFITFSVPNQSFFFPKSNHQESNKKKHRKESEKKIKTGY